MGAYEGPLPEEDIVDRYHSSIPSDLDALVYIAATTTYYGFKSDVVYSADGVFSVDVPNPGNKFYGVPHDVTAAAEDPYDSDKVLFMVGADYYVFSLSSRSAVYGGEFCFPDIYAQGND